MLDKLLRTFIKSLSKDQTPMRSDRQKLEDEMLDLCSGSNLSDKSINLAVVFIYEYFDSARRFKMGLTEDKEVLYFVKEEEDSDSIAGVSFGNDGGVCYIVRTPDLQIIGGDSEDIPESLGQDLTDFWEHVDG